MTFHKWLVLSVAFLVASPIDVSNAKAKECGIKGPSSRIVGGRTAAPGEFPWQVSIQGHGSCPGCPWVHGCGGTIISEDWILTAAHCSIIIAKNAAARAACRVVVGAWNVSSTSENTQSIGIDRVFVHPGYVDENMTDAGIILNPGSMDIALLKLNRSINFNDPFVGPACMPNLTNEYRGRPDCVVSGWGLTEHEYEQHSLAWIMGPHSTLQKASGRIWTRKAAQAAWAPVILDDALLAFGRPRHAGMPGMMPCHGDSGGPLVCKEENGAYSVVGVFSTMPDNCTTSQGETQPGLFTEVAAVNDWLLETQSLH